MSWPCDMASDMVFLKAECIERNRLTEDNTNTLLVLSSVRAAVLHILDSKTLCSEEEESQH